MLTDKKIYIKYADKGRKITMWKSSRVLNINIKNLIIIIFFFLDKTMFTSVLYTDILNTIKFYN